MSRSILDAIDDDDDSENDSDYNPNEADGEGFGEKAFSNSLTSSSSTSDIATIVNNSINKRKVNELWNDLQQEDDGYLRAKKDKLNFYATTASTSHRIPMNEAPITEKMNYCASPKSNVDTATRNKNYGILESIFGKSEALKMVNKRNIDDQDSHQKGTTVNPLKKRNHVSNDVKEAVKNAVKNLRKKQKVTETRKFAGQSITIEKTVIGAAYTDNSSNISSSSKTVSSTLDGVLETIKGPKAVSTVSKSSIDWDTYKEKEGLADELSKASHDGYLTRQEFLERCDYRNFESEKEIRLKAMTANLTQTSGSI